MRIGFDIDGVLADFHERFIERIITVTGKDLFPPRPFDIPCWQYLRHYGYTPNEENAVWVNITKDPTFWFGLNPYDGASDVIANLRILSYAHDVYFITSRPGFLAKQQTEAWLTGRSGDFLWVPTVLISSDKGGCAKALKLDAYVDDRWENCQDTKDLCLTFMIDRPWNRDRGLQGAGLVRVSQPASVLDALGLTVSGVVPESSQQRRAA